MSKRGRRSPIIPNQAATVARRPAKQREEPRPWWALNGETMPPGVICLPTLDKMWSESALAILGGLDRPAYGVTVPMAGTRSIAQKRNNVIAEALKTEDVQWILFCDDDMTPPADALRRLWATGKDVVGGLSYQRQPPFAAEAGYLGLVRPDGTRRTHIRECFLSPDDAHGQLIEVDWIGAGFMLVRRAVLEAVPAPWFVHPEDQPGTAEDIHFCQRVRAAGFSIWCDTSVQPGHMASFPISHKYVTAMQPALGEAWEDMHAYTQESGLWAQMTQAAKHPAGE